MSWRNAVLSFLLAAAAATAMAGDQGPRGLQPPKDKPHRPVGIKAVEPRPGGGFKKEDVGNYLHTFNLPRNQGPSQQLGVVSLEFMSVSTLRTRIPADTTGFDGGEQVGLALLEGPLAFRSPQGGEPFTASKGYAVFDADTGNLLIVGTLEQ